MIFSHLSDYIYNLIIILKTLISDHIDMPNWYLSNDENFNLKSTYNFISGLNNDTINMDSLFNQVWHWKCPT